MACIYPESSAEKKDHAQKCRTPISLQPNDDTSYREIENAPAIDANKKVPSLKQKLVTPDVGKIHLKTVKPLTSCSQTQNKLRENISSNQEYDTNWSIKVDETEVALMNKWTLSPMSSLKCSSLSEIPFISPQVTINTSRSSPGSAKSEIRVETGLIHILPRELCLSARGIPCAIFALMNLETGKPRWLFVKEYDQLANFNELIQSLLAPLFRQTKFRLREFPSRDLFQSKSPWKVDLRNDMLNAYFKSIFWFSDIEHYQRDQVMQEAVERALHALWLYDKVEPSPMRSFGPYGDEMCGFLLSRAEGRPTDWNCHYYAMNGSFLDIIDDLSTVHVRDSICLCEARIEKLIVLYRARPDNARYAINIYETSSSKMRTHTLCAENENMRQKWLYHLSRRVAHLTDRTIPRDTQSARELTPLPYVLPGSSHKSPYLPEVTWNVGARLKKNTQHVFDLLAADLPDISLMSYLFHNSEHANEEKEDWNYNTGCPRIGPTEPIEISVREISSPLTTVKITGNAVLGNAMADTQEIQLNDTHPNLPSRGRTQEGDLSRNSTHLLKGSTISTNEAIGCVSSSYKVPEKSIALVFGIMPGNCKHLIQLSEGLTVPSVIARCLEVLFQGEASEEVGLFRISGTQTRLDELESLFDRYGDYDMIQGAVDVHTSADLLKRYLRGLPDSLLVEYSETKIQQMLAMDDNQRVQTIKSDMSSLNPVSYAVVRVIIRLLYRVNRRQAKNSMGLRNLGVAMSPSLRVPIPILEIYIKLYKAIFA